MENTSKIHLIILVIPAIIRETRGKEDFQTQGLIRLKIKLDLPKRVTGKNIFTKVVRDILVIGKILVSMFAKVAIPFSLIELN